MPPKSRLKRPKVDLGKASLGERLTRVRKSRGLTQVELAQLLGLIQSLISDYKNDKLRPHGEMVARFSRSRFPPTSCSASGRRGATTQAEPQGTPPVRANRSPTASPAGHAPQDHRQLPPRRRRSLTREEHGAPRRAPDQQIAIRKEWWLPFACMSLPPTMQPGPKEDCSPERPSRRQRPAADPVASERRVQTPESVERC